MSQSFQAIDYAMVHGSLSVTQTSSSYVEGYACRLFGPKRDEVTGGWRKLHNEELHKLYSSPSIIRMTKARRMKLAGHVAQMGRREMHIRYLWENLKERDHWEYKDVGGEQY
jgi:hypothetical protein